MPQRPPHLLPGQSPARRAQLLFESPLEAWREEVGRGGLFSAEKLAALATVLMIIFSQLSFAAVPAAQAATPSFKSVSTAGDTFTSGVTIDVPVPAGVVAGDLLIAQVTYNAPDPSSITPGAGWNVIDVASHPTEALVQGLYWREATGSEPAQYSFTLNAGGTGKASGAIAAYSDVNMASPIDSIGSQSGTSTGIVAPSITVTQAGTTLVGFFAVRDGGAIGPPGSMTERWDVASGGGGPAASKTVAEGADEFLAAAGATGTRTATAGAVQGNIGHLVALAPSQVPSNVIVNSTGDAPDNNVGDDICDTGGTVGSDPECTLRAAIQQTNASAVVDTIEFNIPQTDTNYSASPVGFRIRPNSLLPEISTAMTLDASTQPESATASRPVVEVDGTNVSAGEENGLWITGGGTTVRGFALNNWGDDAIDIEFLGGNTVVGNYIGTDVTGNAAEPNVWGVNIKTPGNTVGGDTAADRNVISGNTNEGVYIKYAAAASNTVTGNYIGTNAVGTAGIANGTEGVIIFDSAANNQIGGINPGEGNRIAFNGSDGVQISSDAGSGNAIVGNEIYANVGMGIDIDPNGVNSNDIGDGDPGANDLLNFPVIASASEVGGSVTVDFGLDVPDGSYRVEFFTNSVADGSGNGEGETFASSIDVSVAGGVPTPGSHTFTGSAGDIVSATATEGTAAPFGSTSEFSPTFAATADPSTAVVNSTGNTGDSNTGDGVCETGGTVGSDPECTLRAAIEQANGSGPIDTIEFSIPVGDGGYSAGVWRIRTGGALDYLSQPVSIDGSTQPGYTSTPVIHLDGLDLSSGEDGFHFLNTANGSRLEAMAVTGFPDVGVIVNANNVSVVNNHIGVMPDGVTGAGNTNEGIIVSDAATDTIVRGNLVGDNGATAIALNTNSTGTIVAGNVIGTDATGVVDLGNAQAVWADTTGSAIVGGTNATDANVIAFSSWDGVELRNSGPGIAVLRNSIYSNGYLGIDTVDAGDPASGVTVNDGGDGDSGPNGLLNFPVITSATESAGTVTANFDLDVLDGDYRVEFFSNSAADGSGYGEGETFVGSVDVTVSSGIPTPASTILSGVAGDIITATATEGTAVPFGGTSEFSPTYTVTSSSVTVDALWLTTRQDVGSPSGAPGLDSWAAGEALTLQDPSLALAPATTNGTFSVAFDVEPHVVGLDAAIDGLHYVGYTLTVGSANAVNLEPGDLLFSTEDNETYTVAGFTAADEDIVLFEPTVAGDYTSGTFSLLYDMGTFDSDDTRALTLAEKAVIVAGVNVPAGTLFIGRESRRDIIRIDLTDVGPGTAGSESEFADGPTMNFGSELWGLELVEDNTTIGGAVIPAGRFLGTLNNDGSTVGTTGQDQVAVQSEDIFSLNVITPGASPVVGAYALFDGSQLNLDSSAEEVVGLTLGNPIAAGNVDPVANDDTETTLADTAAVIDVLANDTDANGDTLSVQSVTQGTNGSVVNNGTDVTYTPNASWTGIDTFTYTASDGNGGTGTATVTVTVAATSVGPGGVVGNLGLWLRADLGLTESGGTVSAWADQSGNGNDAAAPTSAHEPALVSAALNDNPALGFDGFTDLMDAPGGGNSSTYYVVLVPGLDVSSASAIQVPFSFDCDACASNSGGLHLGSATAALTDEIVSHTVGNSTEWRSAETGATTYSAGEPMLIAVRDNAAANGTDIFAMGAETDNATAGSFMTVTDALATIGASNPSSPFAVTWYDGQVAEVITMSARSSDAEHQRIQSYLAIKYGLTLDQAVAYNYVRADGTVIWNATANASYNNDIAGIGHDDASSLLQSASQSVNSGSIVAISNASSQDSGDFLVWGNDGGAITWTATGSPVGQRLQRTWRADETGEIGTVTVSVDVGGLPTPGVVAGDYHLLVDSDGDFSSGATAIVADSFVGGVATFNLAPLSGGDYFTVATTVVEVNSTRDVGDSNTGDGVCDTGFDNTALVTECTLRAAIEHANATGGAESIVFDMPTSETGHSGGVWTISPTSQFDQLSETVIIDGRTQTGWTATPVVEINGAGAGALADGFRVAADDIEIRGLAINRFLADGIEVASGAGDAVIAANHIGVDAVGLLDRGNANRGVDLGAGSHTTTVGGTDPEDRNIISGNGDDGIIIWNSNSNVITGNYIGTDITGNAPIANGADGVALGGTSAANLIGQPGDTNVISGNVNDGVENDATGINNAIYANIIGLGADGDTAVPNGRHGVVFYDGANTSFIYQNLISGNAGSGIIMDANDNPATAGNLIAANVIGTNLAGDADRGNGSHGIHFFGGPVGNTIGGTAAANRNVISGNGGDGIFFEGAGTSMNTIQGNWIGLTTAGDAALGNSGNGIEIDWEVPNQLIGGSVAGAGNVISGNTNGIYAFGAADLTIQGNLIGLNAAGDTAVPNTDDGIQIRGNDPVIGGTSSLARNIVSGNGSYGIYLDSTTNAVVQGNYVGTEITGMTAVPNSSDGIFNSAPGSTFGGTAVGAGNVISGNANDGIQLSSSSTGTKLHGNYIGVDATGSGPLSNSWRGVALYGGGMAVGGDAAGEPNIIAHNGLQGITVQGAINGTSLLGNSIHSNGSRGIDLNWDGVTANDPGDGDTGPNDYLNFPGITSASEIGGTVSVELDLDVPAGDYRIEFFTNAAADPTGNGEGEAFAGFYDVVGHPGGSVSYSTSFAGTVGDILTATTTENLGASYGSTSEFSVAVTVIQGIFVVNATGDASDNNAGDGSCDTGGTNSQGAAECTLRAALEEGNALAGADTITFNVPTTEVGYSAAPLSYTIQVGVPTTNPLPAITGPLTIDGTTQPDFPGTPIVVLDAAAALGLDVNGLNIQAGPSTIRGLVIVNASDDGLEIETAGGNTIVGNYVGVGPDGLTAAANGWGISIKSNGNTIGGAGQRNVISGNANYGIGFYNAASGNNVQGNYIGVTAAGDIPLGNGSQGVFFEAAANNNFVGGTAAGAGNTISGNGADGVYLIDVGTTANVLIANHIGTNAAGDAAVPNGRAGVYVEDGAASNIVGGGSPAHRNIISGNSEDGIYITGVGTDGNIVAGNYIGTNAAGDAPIPNGDRGVQVESGASDNLIGLGGSGNVISGNTGDGVIVADWLSLGTTGNDVVDNLIGLAADGTTPVGNGANGIHLDPVATTLISGNTIAHNGADGIVLEPATLSGNSIIGNSIHSNSQLGIDLGNNGVTPNDGGDVDGGPNDVLNFPVITSAIESGGTVDLDFDLDVPAGDYRIEFFDNTAADPSGNGEGETFLGFYDVVGHAGGSASHSTSFAGAVGDIITATATEEVAAPFGSTSEFSTAYTVTAPDATAPVITLVGANPQTIEVGSAYTELGATAFDDVDGDISGSIVIDTTAVNTALLGSYTVTYNVSDSSGNPATEVTRTVDVVDTTAPVLTLLGSNPMTIEVGGAYTEPGATASDNHDGDLTGPIVINSSAVNTAFVGSYVVTYDVTDSSGNPASGIRTVNVVDTTAPVITLTGANPQTLEVNTPYVELGATASDNYDGDISGSISVDTSAVDMGAVGSYTVTYSVTDSEGNAAVQVSRTVDVVDTTLPVITLTGANPQMIEVGSGYSELGATALDNYDGDISGSIAIDATAVNTAVVGSYTVTYDVTDTEGNAAVQVARTVDVVDTTLPAITLVGANPQTIEVGGAYSELGATASDNYDGDITGSIVVNAGAVNTAVVGSYTATYDVTDSEGNVAVQVTRTVDVVDTTLPVITLVGANPQVIEVGSGYSELGATALDNYDGDSTGSIVIDSSAVNMIAVGSYVVTYNVTDSEGNAAIQVSRTVDVVDTTLPMITLVGANPQVIEVGSGYAELGATALDNYDGDITGSIVIDATAVDTAVVGSYTVTYDVTDSEGNAAVQVTRTVDVVDTTLPVITLVGANPQVIEVNSAYSELGATALDNNDGDITGSIVVDSSAVNTAAVGSYAVTYNVTDSEGNDAVQVSRTVDVVDTTLPVITLAGANPQVIEVASVYTELGATALDNYDGDLTGSIAINASAVNTAVVGSYTVTYDVSDANSNAAVPVTRTVNVVDTTNPVITLTGANPQVIEVGSGYAELGATSSDNYDGDLTGSIVINSSAVNITVVGSYLVTYDVVDSSGNPDSAIRTVDVVDTTLPVITLVGANPQVIEFGSPYVELGATASDNYDGDLTGSIVIDSSAVNVAVVGAYDVFYNVTDANGNAAAQVTRTVTIVDTANPVITLTGANPQTIEVGSAYTELGATATDNYDGDLTGSIVINVAAVNTATVGTYVVTYDVADSSGNPASAIRTVDVVDTTAPVITLVGANPQTVEVGSGYIELGATALDNYDGDISGSIAVDSSAVVTSVVGSYSVTYDVTDSEGNAATQVIRTVDVVDTTAPVITLVGANPQTVEGGSPYVELGATASDVGDGDLTGSITTDSSAVNPATVGSYPVTYDVTDSQGNAATQVIRTVDVVDTTAPVITLVGADPQVLEVNSSYVEQGATASDIGDGDLTGSVVIDTSAVNMGLVGSYIVTYDVTDSQGNPATQVTRTVEVVDTTAPVITLIGANPQTIEAGASYVELGATASDNYDGDITGSVVIDATAVDTATVGSYPVTYNVTDSEGNAAVQVTRTVDTVDTTSPVITLVGANPQVIEVGSPYAELGATAFDVGDGVLTGSIVTDATAVNTAVVGSYTVTYDVTDSQGNAATQATRTVDVVDTTLPVITLVGANPQVVEAGSAYVELGATAIDNYDGDLTASIVIDASAVDTAVVGSYGVTYYVTDVNGNAAVQVTRTVNVVDTTAPVISLLGANPQVIEVGSPYVELGATASDVGDGDLTASIVIDATAVNTGIVGSYAVTYDVADSQGNPAIQVIRAVNVVDTTLPVITLAGANPQTIEAGSPYVELGATATDNYDGDISGSIVINSVAVNAAVVGSYSVTYDATDANGNDAIQVIRTVDVIDTTAPVITLVGANPQVIEVGSPYTELGATATDIGDGDLTGSIITDASGVDTGVVGLYTVTYDVTDSQGNAGAQVTRTVDVVDTTLPVITVVGPDPQVIEVGSPYLELGATALDNYDGDLTGSIVTDGTAVNTGVVGSYAVTYNVTDSNGNAAVQVTRTVDVVDTTLPVITLVGPNPQVIEVGSAYVELGATALDNYDGDLTGSIATDGTAVNTAVVGSYAVTYNVTDSNGNAAVQVTRTVDMVDTTVPVITLVGANPQVIEVGSPYLELGATALDNYDGDITAFIVVNATAVNTAVVSSYVVTYDVVDSNGNPAFGFRTVNVVDTTVPVITMVGPNPQTIEAGSPYVELGATALDNYDGDITGSVVIDASAVNTAVVGGYPVTYNVTDSNGNAAVQITRTVDVVDTTAPVITLVGANPQSVGVGSPYVELGATALDNYDGDITGSVVIDASAVDTAVVGSYPVTYNVSDSNGNAATQVTRTVNVVNVAPTLGFIGDQTIAEGTLATFTASASDPDPTDPLTFSLSGAPAGAVIDPTTGVFIWTPTEAQGPNSFAFDVVVTDGGTPALSDTQTVTINVTEVNLPPAIGAIGPQTVDELTSLTFSIPVSDPDMPANGLTFILSGAPAGATVDPVTGVFSWTPTEAQGPGVYVFDVAVSDNGVPSLGDTQAVSVTVGEVNVAPSVTSPGDQAAAEAETILLPIAATDADIPANTLTYSAIDLPDGLTIDAGTGEISGIIDYTANASSPFTAIVTVTDNGTPIRSSQITFTWTVADTNRPPVAAPDTEWVAEDTTQIVDVLANDSDPDADPVTISSVGPPTHGAAVIGNGGIAYVPDPNYFGPDSFLYTISDGRGGLDSAVVSLTVTSVNDVPSLTVLTSMRVDEGTMATFGASSSDVEGDGLTFTLAGAPSGAAIDPASGTFIWTPAENQGPASYTFDVVVTDDGIPARSAARQVRIDVNEVNVAPIVVDPGTQISAENETVVLPITASDSDVPAGTIRFGAAGLPPGLSIDPVTGVIGGVIPFDAASGSAFTLTVTATDNGTPQLSGQAVFDWRVRNTNRPPSALDIVIFAEAGIPTSLVLSGSDPDGDTLTFSIAGPPSQGALYGGPRLYDYTAEPAASGSDTFTFVVSDGDLQATGTVSIEITPNLPPVGRPDEYTARRGGVLVVDVPGVLGNDRDPEGRPITATVDTVPAYGELTLRPDGSFFYSNRADEADLDTFTYRVEDGMRTSEPVTVVLNLEDNLAPVVNADIVTLDEDTGITFRPLDNDYDPNGEPVLISDVTLPANGVLQWSLDGAFRYRPTQDWNGTDVIEYFATDGDLVSIGRITITVMPINDAPTASSMEITGNSGESVIVDLRPFAADVDGDSLEFLLESPAAGSVERLSSGVFEIYLDGVVRDLAPLTFVASDPAGERASSVVTVYVRIPAELVGVPSLVSDDLGDGPTPADTAAPPEPPADAPLMTGLRLMVGSVLDTFQAIRLPLFALLAIVIGSLYLGLSKKFVFANSPTVLPLGAREKVDVVMAQSSAGVPARAEAGGHQSVVHRFRPDETGIVTTGARSLVRSEVWVEVETPEGDAWVDAEFITEQRSKAIFADDQRPHELVEQLVEQFYQDGDLLVLSGSHDLHVALYGPPVRFAASSLSRLLSAASVYWWWGPSGDTPKHQGTFAETVGESMSAAFRNRGSHDLLSQYPVPVEFANMHSLVVGNDGLGEGWRIFFRYENDEPSIAGLMREAQPNPAAMHGEMVLKSA